MEAGQKLNFIQIEVEVASNLKNLKTVLLFVVRSSLM
jgi:hypothetical protein